MTYLLDTNACIDFLDGRSDLLASRMEEHFGDLAVSSITVAELLVGSRISADPESDARKIEAFVSGVDVADFDLDCARRYGAVIRNIGVRRRSYDRLIGIQALELGATLVTRNEKDFADVPGLTVENWTA